MKYQSFGFPVNKFINKHLYNYLSQVNHLDDYIRYCSYFGCIYSAKIEGVFYVYPTHVYLDDERRPPRNWFIVDNVGEMNDLLTNCPSVKTISLDHDLGLEVETGTGYDVLLYIEQMVFEGKMKSVPEILIHTANMSAKPKMEAAVASIRRLLQKSI